MRTPFDYLRGVMHPEAYHGRGKATSYFEGWYVKLVSADRSQRWAVIPGEFKGLGGSSRNEAFVQVLNGSTGESWYHAFPEAEFSASSDRFDVSVAGNRFDASGVTLDLPQLRGRIDFATPFDPWPVTFREPGIMGWYGMVPFMECFHGIVSFGHELAGALSIDGRSESFAGGRGYIEKDWGEAFPSGYIWMHSNHFDSLTPGVDLSATSLVGSVAIIPWLGSAFRGFIIGLRHEGQLHKWTTYNRSSEIELQVSDETIEWVLDGPSGRLELNALRKRGGLLHAPLREAMHQRVDETLDSTIRVKFVPSRSEQAGEICDFEASAQVAGLEVFGDIERLQGLKKKTRA